MLSKISQRKTNTICSHLHVESKKAEPKEIENRMVVVRGWGLGKWKMLVKEYKFPAVRRISSRDLIYNMVTIIYNTVLCTWKLGV